ncbi:hypothetical protein SAMN04487959_1345 [Modicisalibacter xianhensis]|uniref:Uncharacterized protein n=1 Tax=Modicisalibacter xianhensis TaxID=442341 RepID=A0A1I3GKS7_9GAMM|nr:hypothetical protein SAMN04487959_1345 [Halomonas xianhensis]
MSYSEDFSLLRSRQFNIKRDHVFAGIPSQEILCAVDPATVPNRKARRLIRKAQRKSKGGGQ